jgi:type III secretion protein Q
MTQLRESVSILPIPVLTQLSSPPEEDGGEGPVVTLSGRGEMVAGQIQVRFHQCPEAQPTSRQVSPRSPLFALPFDISFRAVLARLTEAELLSIEPGDVVILDEASMQVADDGSISGRCALAAPGAPRRADCELTQDGAFRIVELDLLEAVMSEPVKSPDTESADAADEAVVNTTDLSQVLAEDVELTLAAELGRLRLSLAHASSYEVGSVLRLGKPVGAEVDLTLAGRLVGRGELLNIDGELGVRVSQWSV